MNKKEWKYFDDMAASLARIDTRNAAREAKERRKLLEGENRVFTLNEGTCPNCYHDVKLIDVSGTKAFLFDHQPKEGVESRQWNEPSPDDWVVGSFTFKCQNPECGKEHYIEQMRDGDWA